MKKQVAIIFGTRPEAIKLIPVYIAMQASSTIVPILVSTGQHKEMLAPIFGVFNVSPDIELSVMSEKQTLTSLSAKLFEQLGNLFASNRLDGVVVQGDTTTAFVAAVAAFYERIKVYHVEAGLRTYQKWSPFPEESNRKMIAAVADFHFTPTAAATRALQKESIIEGVFQVGNTVIDSLHHVNQDVQKNQALYENQYAKFIETGERLILVTGHRRESFGQGFKNICQALLNIADNAPNLRLVYPVHLNPNVKNVVEDMLGKHERIHLINPVAYPDMVFLMSQAWLILTDSGGVQEEAPSLNVPVLVMRNTTERQEGIDAGCAMLVGTETESIVKGFNVILRSDDTYQNMCAAPNPYGDGKSSSRILEIIENSLS